MAILVCSSDLHAQMFSGVARELEALGWDVAALSLDPLYGQGATPAAARQGMRVATFETDGAFGASSAGAFHARPTIIVWRDVRRARRGIGEAISALEPTVVVVGNDRGLIEKLVLSEARRRAALTVLVQDGAIAEVRTPESSFRRRLWRGLRSIASRVLRSAGGGVFAATAYGEGGCDLVCVTGPAAIDTFRRRGTPRSRIVVTGHPRYDGLPSGGVAGNGVVWFTTPFEAQNLGGAAQRAQTAFIDETASALQRAGIRLTIKVHPREALATYDAFRLRDGVSVASGSPISALDSAELAVIGISTVTEEAVLVGVPVAVPGQRIHGGPYADLLPEPRRFPRIERGDDVVTLVHELRSSPARRRAMLAHQVEWVSDRVHFDASEPAARRIAGAVDRLARP